MKIIIIILLLSLWVVLDSYFPIETYVSQDKETELNEWFDLATELKTEISCIENFT